MITIDTRTLTKLLRVKYSPPSWAFFTNVPDGTGSNVSGWADAIAMGIWPSRGLHLHGFELKVSRGDWLKELKNPAKADKFAVYCDYWWVVAGDLSIVRDEELPPTWGLQVAQKNGIVIKQPADKRQPLAIDRHLLAAICRRATEQGRDAEEIQKTRDEGFAAGQKQAESFAKSDKRHLEDLQKLIDEFEKASGIQIDRWNEYKLGRIAETVKLLLKNSPVQAMKTLASQAEEICKTANAAIAELAKESAA